MFNTFAKTFLTNTVISGSIAIGSLLSFATVPVQAFQIFFGEDLNNNGSVPLPSFPNSSAAESDFLSNLIGVGTEDFESFSAGTGSLIDLTFPGSTDDITAILSGGGGTIQSVPAGSTNEVGRYGTSPTNFFEVAAGGANNFQVNFDTPIAAFGFFGVDIGDFGGQLELELANGTTQIFTVPNEIGSSGSTDGSILFYGVIAENASEIFQSVDFLTTTGGGDVFAFDDFTIGELEQVTNGGHTIPEPSLILSLLAVGGLGSIMKLKR